MDAAVNSLDEDMGVENKRYVDQLILATNENVNSKVMLIDGTNQPTNDRNWNHNKIKHLEDPTDNLDAVNKHLDLMLCEKTFNYSLGSAQEDLNMNTRQIFNLGNPTEPKHCATRECVDRLFNCLIFMINSGA